MPVRSLSSSVIKWPSKSEVKLALEKWAEKEKNRGGVLAIAAFGSFCDESWGVGSDLDLLIVISQSDLPFSERPSLWDTLSLPVPVDLMVYTEREWIEMSLKHSRFSNEVLTKAVWIYGQAP